MNTSQVILEFSFQDIRNTNGQFNLTTISGRIISSGSALRSFPSEIQSINTSPTTQTWYLTKTPCATYYILSDPKY
jgi:hypothetical protein